MLPYLLLMFSGIGAFGWVWAWSTLLDAIRQDPRFPKRLNYWPYHNTYIITISCMIILFAGLALYATFIVYVWSLIFSIPIPFPIVFPY